MKEPEIIGSGAAHEVSMAPGSSVAKSHVAAPRETVVRQKPAVEPEYIVEGSPSGPDAVALGKPKQDEVPPLVPALAQNRGRLFTAEPTAPTPQADDDEEIAPEMNFPARLVHLKMENDKMRTVLAELEHSFEAP
jgi:hypothetical protein